MPSGMSLRKEVSVSKSRASYTDSLLNNVHFRYEFMREPSNNDFPQVCCEQRKIAAEQEIHRNKVSLLLNLIKLIYLGILIRLWVHPKLHT